VSQPTRSREETALRSAKRYVDLILTARKENKLDTITTSTIRELMSYLTILADSNKAANTLEDLCVGAILAHNNGEYSKYGKYLKDIIRIGGGL